jgi:hypothetical protein
MIAAAPGIHINGGATCFSDAPENDQTYKIELSAKVTTRKKIRLLRVFGSIASASHDSFFDDRHRPYPSPVNVA